LLIAWLALACGLVWSAWKIRRPDASARWGWAYYAVALNIAFLLLGPTMRSSTTWRADALLQSMDARLIGDNLSLRLQPLVSVPLNELFSLSYMAFIVLLFGALVFYLLRSPHLARCYTGLFTLYGIGFAGYVLLPAAGPYVAMRDVFSVAIEGGAITALNALMVQIGSNQVDVFPSLHIAVSLFLWLTLLKDHRAVGVVIAPLVILLWLSTIYLRYHYFIDIVCGAALAVAAFLATYNRVKPVPVPASIQNESTC
jgi:membrane-associated phospholipid phosphatase